MQSANVVDVVIPVFNAPRITQRCLDSVMKYLGNSVNRIHVQDDASDTETRELLDRLTHQGIHVFHSQVNQGFGGSVNQAIGRSEAPLVLVLNSDIEVLDNFLPPLVAALEADPELAVVSPAGQPYDKYDLDRYCTSPVGCVRTHRLRGHAFLIRRQVFEEVGGFDHVFGKGYFEDLDLGRRLTQRGWRMGVHRVNGLVHEVGASFGRGARQKQLQRRNRALYFSRYPAAKRNVLILSGACELAGLPAAVLEAADQVLGDGARVDWLEPSQTSQLSALEMYGSRTKFRSALRLILVRGLYYGDKRISEIWFLDRTPRLLGLLLRILAGCCRIRVRTWSGEVRP